MLRHRLCRRRLPFRAKFSLRVADVHAEISRQNLSRKLGFFLFRNSFINVLREKRECIAYAYRKGFINDRQFVLLYDANTPVKKTGLSILEV